MSSSTIDPSSSQTAFQQYATLFRSMRESSGFQGGSASSAGFGPIVNQLQNPAASDPTLFQQQTADIASRLNTLAGQTSGFEAQLFQNLATQFQQASQTGQVPRLADSPHGRSYDDSMTFNSAAENGFGPANLTQTTSTSSTPQIAQNSNGTYGPENALDPFTAEVQAVAGGLGFGQTFELPDGTCGVVA
ncbi:MAG: hypothetical protein ACLQBJ_01945 [Bryobacteraceae bacterium]